MANTQGFLSRPDLVAEAFDESVELPYGLTTKALYSAMDEVYQFLHQVNSFLIGKGYDRLEELILGNSLSGIISELIVKGIARNTTGLARNSYVGGHPDLLPEGKYPGNHVLRGDEGIEVKTSIQSGGWQGHNPETGWVMVFQFTFDSATQPAENRRPLEFIRVMIALLEPEDWSFSGRQGASRRTPTASILRSGVQKLRDSTVYIHPRYDELRKR